MSAGEDGSPEATDRECRQPVAAGGCSTWPHDGWEVWGKQQVAAGRAVVLVCASHPELQARCLWDGGVGLSAAPG